MRVDEEAIARRFAALSPYLDERQRRLWLGVEAREAGHGGVSAVARATGMSRPTVAKAVKELNEPVEPLRAGRVRRAGGGRKPITETDPELVSAPEMLVDPATRGDPQSPLRWTSKSTRQLAQALAAQGHPVSHSTVGDLLNRLGYSLQAAVKTREGNQHPDRDGQFRYLALQVNTFMAAGDPVVSVDTKKKELVGAYKNGGREWQPAGAPVVP
jgi:transposase